MMRRDRFKVEKRCGGKKTEKENQNAPGGKQSHARGDTAPWWTDQGTAVTF